MFTNSLTKKIRTYEKLLEKTITDERCTFIANIGEPIQWRLMQRPANALLNIFKEIIGEKVLSLTQDADDTNKQKSIYNAAMSLIKSLHKILSDTNVMSSRDFDGDVSYYHISLWFEQDKNDWCDVTEESWEAITKKYLKKNFVKFLSDEIFNAHKIFYRNSKRTNSCCSCLFTTSEFSNKCIDLSYPHKKRYSSLAKTLDTLGFETEESPFVIKIPQSLMDGTSIN